MRFTVLDWIVVTIFVIALVAGLALFVVDINRMATADQRREQEYQDCAAGEVFTPEQCAYLTKRGDHE